MLTPLDGAGAGAGAVESPELAAYSYLSCNSSFWVAVRGAGARALAA